MHLALKPPHLIARYNYAPRMVSFAFSFLTFCILWIDRGRFSAWEFFSGILTLLVYPHLAYLHARLAVDSKRAELNNLYADSLVLGAWTAQIHFALWPTVALLTAVSLNSTSYGFLGRLFRSLAVFGASAAAWGAVIGYDFKPDTGPLVTTACIFGMLAYVSWVGAIVFVQNSNLLRTRKADRTGEEQFRFIAENVGDMVSVLDTQGRFVYASSSYAKHFEPDAFGSGADWLLLVHPEDRDQAKSFLNSIVTSLSRKRAGLRLASARGPLRKVEFQGNPVRDDAGKVKMIVLVSHDLEAFSDSKADDRLEARRDAFADGQSFWEEKLVTEKQVLAELLAQVMALNKKAAAGPPPKLDSVEGVFCDHPMKGIGRRGLQLPMKAQPLLRYLNENPW